MEYSVRERSALCLTLPARRCPWGPPEKRVGFCPTRPGGRAFASCRFRPPDQRSFSDIPRTVPSTGGVRLRRAADPIREVLVNTIGHQELRILGPSVIAFTQPDLIVAQRFAMRRGSVLLMWGAVPDMAVENDEGGASLLLSENIEGMLDAADVIGVADPQYVPSIPDKPGLDVLGEGDAGASLDRDVVVVVDPAEVVEC